MTARRTATSTKPVTAKKPAAARATKAPPAKPNAVAPSTKAGVVLAKDTKPRKVKLIRDSFTMPFFDYDLIDALKIKALNAKVVVKKSELLRAGLLALSKLSSKELTALVGTLAVVKTGRPKK
jgi:hypothetical protein